MCTYEHTGVKLAPHSVCTVALIVYLFTCIALNTMLDLDQRSLSLSSAVCVYLALVPCDQLDILTVMHVHTRRTPRQHHQIQIFSESLRGTVNARNLQPLLTLSSEVCPCHSQRLGRFLVLVSGCNCINLSFTPMRKVRGSRARRRSSLFALMSNCFQRVAVRTD